METLQESKRLSIEQLEIGKCYFSEGRRQRYKIIWIDKKKDVHTGDFKKVLVVKTETMDRKRSKSNTYLTRNDVDWNFFHLSTNNPQW